MTLLMNENTKQLYVPSKKAIKAISDFKLEEKKILLLEEVLAGVTPLNPETEQPFICFSGMAIDRVVQAAYFDAISTFQGIKEIYGDFQTLIFFGYMQKKGIETSILDLINYSQKQSQILSRTRIGKVIEGDNFAYAIGNSKKNGWHFPVPNPDFRGYQLLEAVEKGLREMMPSYFELRKQQSSQ